MKAQILLLKQDSKAYVKFERHLREKDYQIVTSKNKVVDRQEILLGVSQVDLVLILSDEGSDYWLRGLELKSEFPWIGFVFYSVAPVIQRSGFKENLLCRVIDQKLSKAEFYRVIQNSVEMTQAMHKEISDTNYAPQLSCLSGFFDTLDLNFIVGQMLRYVHEIFQCQDVIWIKKDEFQTVVQCFQAEKQREEKYQSFDRIARIRSLIEPTEKNFISRIGEFSFAMGRESKDVFVSPTLNSACGKTDLLYPILNREGASALGYLLLVDPKVTEGKISIANQLDRVLKPFTRHLEFSLEVWNFKHDTYKDDLTGLYNQKYMGMVMETEIEKARSEGLTFSVLFLDVDYFKQVNDVHGHWVGSQILIQLGKVFKESVRSSDYAFRYGGDEYVILLVGSSKTGALIAGERVRKAVEDACFKVDGLELNVTVSIGLSNYPDDGLSFEQMIKVADQAMYYGKNKSRNIVYIAS